MSSEDSSSEQASPGGNPPTPPSPPSPGVPSISVCILSPSAELPQQLSFPSVPTASTVGELKCRIRDAVSSRPELERLRLIHRGRMLSRDTDTMLDVFGPTAIDDSSAKSLHLVLRPLAADPATSAPPRSSLGRQSPNPTLIRSSPTPHGQAERNVLAEPLDHHLHEHNRATQRIAPAMRHDQMHNLPTPPLPPRHTLHPGEHEGAVNGQPASAFARYVAHQQQMRAAGGMAGLQPGAIPVAGNPNGSNGHDAHRTATEDLSNSQNPFMPGSGGGFTRTYAGPNGHRWHTTVNYSSVTIPNFGHTTTGMGSPTPQNMGPGAMHGMPGIPGLPDLNALLAAAAAGPTGGIPIQHGLPGLSGQPSTANQMTINAATRNHSPQGNNELDLSLEQVNQLRDQIHTLRQRLSNSLGSSLSHGDYTNSPDGSSNPRSTATVRVPTPESSNQSDTHTTSIASIMNTPINPSDQLSTLRMESEALGTSSGPTVLVETRRSPDPVAYVLSSPLGPQALVISPYGLYSSEILHNHNAHRAVEHIHDIQQSTEPRRRVPGRHRAAPPVVHQNDHHRPNHRARAAGNGIPFARLLQGLAPLGANIWLIARLIGFVVLFTGNASWQRTILLVLGAATVFLIQIGILEPVMELVWGPVRRHIEGVLLSANRRRAPDATGNARNVDARGNEVGHARSQGQRQRPHPANTAALFVREHQQGQRMWIFETIRAIERAIIIFVASLVPGLGERHIAEIDAAQETERIANERRAEVEAQEQITARVEVEGSGTDSTNQRQADGASGAEAGPEQNSGDHD